MGVMACSRNACESILCDRYSSELGYICHECFDELEKTKPRSLDDMRRFMSTEKPREYEKAEERSIAAEGFKPTHEDGTY